MRNKFETIFKHQPKAEIYFNVIIILFSFQTLLGADDPLMSQMMAVSFCHS